MKVEIFTIAYNSMPFITRHLAEFEKIKLPWRWHIREGPADLVKDTFKNGGRVVYGRPDGGSSDGTAEYLDTLMTHPNLDIKRRPLWNGKTEQVNDAVAGIEGECLLLEVDCDEMWTAAQIEHMAELFEKHKDAMAAWFYCRYFVGPDLMMSGVGCLGNHTEYEWIRAWRWVPGCRFTKHEPPVVELGSIRNTSNLTCNFYHQDTETEGLVFNHYSWVTPEQVWFKEVYYGYRGALDGWRRLQSCQKFPEEINEYVPQLGYGRVIRAPIEHCFSPVGKRP